MKQLLLFPLVLTSFMLAGEAISVAAPSQPQPITEDVTLKDSALSAEIFEALDVEPTPYGLRRHSRGGSTVLKVDNGLICVKDTPTSGRRNPQPVFSCTLLVGQGWVIDGPDSYRLEGNTPLVYRIFEILKVSDRKSGSMFVKAVRPNGAQRAGSLFSCAIPNSTGADLGDPAICRLRDRP